MLHLLVTLKGPVLSVASAYISSYCRAGQEARQLGLNLLKVLKVTGQVSPPCTARGHAHGPHSIRVEEMLELKSFSFRLPENDSALVGHACKSIAFQREAGYLGCKWKLDTLFVVMHWWTKKPMGWQFSAHYILLTAPIASTVSKLLTPDGHGSTQCFLALSQCPLLL